MTTTTFQAADAQRALRTLSAFVPVRDGQTVSVHRSPTIVTLTAGAEYNVLASVILPGATAAGQAWAPFSVSRAWLASTLRAVAPGKTDEVTITVTHVGEVTIAANGWTVRGQVAHDKTVKPDTKRDAQHPASAFGAPLPHSVTVDSGEFKQAARFVATAADPDNMLPILRQVHCHAGPDQLTMTGTDRYRLHRAHLPTLGDTQRHDLTWLMPAKVVKGIAAHADSANIAFHNPAYEGSKIAGAPAAVNSGSLAVTYQVLRDDYPKIGHIIDGAIDGAIEAGQSRHATFNTRSLADAVRTARAVSPRGQGTILTLAHDHATLSANDDLFGITSPEIPTTLHGLTAEYRVALNPRFLQEALTVLPTGGTATIGVNESPFKPVHIHDPAQPGHDVVIMPVRYAV